MWLKTSTVGCNFWDIRDSNVLVKNLRGDNYNFILFRQKWTKRFRFPGNRNKTLMKSKFQCFHRNTTKRIKTYRNIKLFWHLLEESTITFSYVFNLCCHFSYISKTLPNFFPNVSKTPYRNEILILDQWSQDIGISLAATLFNPIVQ